MNNDTFSPVQEDNLRYDVRLAMLGATVSSNQTFDREMMSQVVLQPVEVLFARWQGDQIVPKVLKSSRQRICGW